MKRFFVSHDLRGAVQRSSVFDVMQGADEVDEAYSDLSLSLEVSMEIVAFYSRLKTSGWTSLSLRGRDICQR